MALRQRSLALAAATVCVVLVFTLLLYAAPPPDALREGVMRFASLGRSPEEAAEREAANDADDDAPAAQEDLPEEPSLNDPFYGDYPMFGGMMDFWMQGNLSRLMKEHRAGRRDLKQDKEMFLSDLDKQ